MDVEKLIRRLRNDADAYRNGETLGRAFADQEDVLDNAATALSTLQGENKQLRGELEYEQEHANAYYQECGQWEAENEKLLSDLRRLQTERDALLAANQHLLAEREQLTAERDAAVKDLNEFLAMDELCPIQCEWCKWKDTFCDGKTPEWRGVQNE